MKIIFSKLNKKQIREVIIYLQSQLLFSSSLSMPLVWSCSTDYTNATNDVPVLRTMGRKAQKDIVIK